MRIKTLYVKNFKSIDELAETSLRDMSITCVIGKNGSGKSNVLYAIKALKDISLLNDEDMYEKEVKSEETVISSIFELEEKDKVFLENYSLKSHDFSKFRVTVSKKKGEDPLIVFEPLDFIYDFSKKIEINLKNIIKLINDKNLIPHKEEVVEGEQNLEEVNPEDSPEEDEDQSAQNNNDLADLHSKFTSRNDFSEITKNQISNYLKNLAPFIEGLTDLSQEEKTNLTDLIKDTTKFASFDIVVFIKNELWSNLSINLLDINSYKLETIAKQTDLESDKNHQFLFDLLSLTGKTAKSFFLKESELSNTQKDASRNLSEKIAKVWPSHEINFGIESQSQNLFFSFQTPQGRSRGLLDLSDGEKWYLRFYTRLLVSQEKRQQVIWLFDEPGQFLHATAQIDLKSVFEETAKESQIVYTSHQPMMIQWHRIERILVAENNKSSGTIMSQRLWTDQDLVSPLREALGLFVGEQMLTGTDHVVIEGVSDYIYLQGWLLHLQKTRTARMWDVNNSALNRTYIPAGSRDSIPLYLLFLMKKTKGKISAIGVADSKDDAEQVKKALDAYGIESAGKSPIKNIGELGGVGSIESIEDLFEPKEFVQLVKEYYAGNWPDVKFSANFLFPKADDLKKGIIVYVNNQLSSKNINYYGDDKDKKLELDKPGVAFLAYEKLIDKNNYFSKDTEKKFEKIFKSIDKAFEQKSN